MEGAGSVWRGFRQQVDGTYDPAQPPARYTSTHGERSVQPYHSVNDITPRNEHRRRAAIFHRCGADMCCQPPVPIMDGVKLEAAMKSAVADRLLEPCVATSCGVTDAPGTGLPASSNTTPATRRSRTVCSRRS